MQRLFVTILLSLTLGQGQFASAETIRLSSTNSEQLTEARFRTPALQPASGQSPAIVLLHHGGGCARTQTTAYADALNKAGYFTIEPCLFPSDTARSRSSVVYLPQVFGALRHLAENPSVDKNRIAVMGGSYGAALAFVSATQWAYRTHADQKFPPFAAHAAFYPGCYVYERFVRERKGRPDLPASTYDEFTGAPVRIYAGGKDDYDDRDPQACEKMISALQAPVQSLVSLKFFPDATHGWDHKMEATFFEPLACKGRGCMNQNQPDSATTREGIADLLDFLSSRMPAR